MKRITVTLQISNSDNKLTQKEWSDFVKQINRCITAYKGIIHFSGGSCTKAPWQNYCFVFEIEDDKLFVDTFKSQVKQTATNFKQDSVAWMQGVTTFI